MPAGKGQQANKKQVQKELKRLGNLMQQAANDLIEVRYETMPDKYEGTEVEIAYADIEAVRVVLVRIGDAISQVAKLL